MLHFAPFAIFAGCGVGKQQRACAVAYHVPYPAFLYYRIYLFLKGWVDKIAQREAVLSLHREKLFDATAYYRCQPVCEYYIFALRRILI